MVVFMLVVGLIVAGFVFWYIPKQKEKAISLGEVCEGITKLDTSVGYECCGNCKELGLQYFKHEHSTSLFGSSVENCYCKEDNDVKQIW